MTYSDFTTLVDQRPDGIVLLEGRRSISPADYERASEVARRLAKVFPALRFRSGNAEGADEAFSAGIAAVDASRLQVIAPYKTHRRGARHPRALYDSPESISTGEEEEIAYLCAKATPENARLVARRTEKGRLAAKAAYLMRDTMKVVGYSEVFSKPLCALFYVDLTDPMAGGTGHTIRVCRQEGVPVAFQDSWGNWEIT